MTANPQLLAFLVVSPLIAWRMYSRIKRLVGRQRSTPIRPWFAVVLFPIVIALIAIVAFAHPLAIGALLGGLAAGVVLGFYGLKLTKFEKTDEGLFYTPNAHIGIALSLLLVVRLTYRMLQLFFVGNGSQIPVNNFGSSPMTLAILGTLAGYYFTYAVGHLLWRSRVTRESP